MAEGTCLQTFRVNFLEDSGSVDYYCPICLELLTKPFLTECCRRHFCNKCICSAKQREDECPLCKERPLKGAVDKQFGKQLNEKLLYCPLKDIGCGWTGQLAQLKNHMCLGKLYGQCKQVTVKCPNKCGAMLLRKNMKKHLKEECGHRPFTCPYCDDHKSVYTDVVANHYPECADYPVACPLDCVKAKMKRSELSTHLETCPNVVVPCPYDDLGCEVTMKRCNLKQHIESPVGISQHQELFVKALADQNQDLESKYQTLTYQLELQVISLKDKCDQMEHSLLQLHGEHEAEKDRVITQLCDTNKKLKLDLSTQHIKQAQLENDLQVVKKENEEMKSGIKSLRRRCNDLENRFSKMKTQLSSSNKQMIKDGMKNMCDKMMAEIRSHHQKVTSTSDTLDRDKQSYNCKEEVVASKNDRLTNSLTVLQSKNSTLEDRLNKLQDQFAVLKDDVTASKPYVDSELHGLNAKVAKIPTGSVVSSEQHQNVEFWIYGYKLIADKMKEKNWKLYLKTMSEVSTQFPDSTSPVIVQVSGYDRAKRDRSILITSPFYTTGTGKYKFELHIHITAYVVAGYGDDTKTYMSVRASLLEGEYDDHLVWPFIGNISVTLLNQIEDADHFTKDIWVPHELVGLEHVKRVAAGQCKNVPWGQSCFINHLALEGVSTQKQYVVNDCMYFRVDASAKHQPHANNCILY